MHLLLLLLLFSLSLPIQINIRSDQIISDQISFTMDVVLEVFDTFACDYLYAKAFPLKSSSTFQAPTLLNKIANGLNATVEKAGAAAGAGGVPVNLPLSNGYVYTPATTFLSFEPSQWAYLSSLPRDNAWRQAFSLFMITW